MTSNNTPETRVRLTDDPVGEAHTGSARLTQRQGSADGREHVVGCRGDVHPGEPQHAVATGHRLVRPPEVALEVGDPCVPPTSVELDDEANVRILGRG